MKTCRYCEQPARLLRFGAEGYPYRSDFGPVWVCSPCGAWVGCHPGTEKPLGGLANAELRAAKMAAHAAFDPLWQRKVENEGCSKSHARRAGYRWLSEQLGIPFNRTHIGYMSLEECRRVVEVCKTPNSFPSLTTGEAMPKEHQAPAAVTNEPMPNIPMTPVTSNQVQAVGYDPQSKTLAVTFTRGTGHVYHYAGVEPQLHKEFMAADSKGKFFGQHVKARPFKKFEPAKAAA